MAKVARKGTLIKIGNDNYVLPPLSVQQYEDFLEVHDNEVDGKKQTSIMINLFLECLKSNYPDLEDRFVKSHLSMVEMKEYFSYLVDLEKPLSELTDEDKKK